MTKTVGQQALPIPNPDDWTDVGGAAEILGKSRAQVYYYADRDVIREYLIGDKRMFWVADVREVRDAFDRLKSR